MPSGDDSYEENLRSDKKFSDQKWASEALKRLHGNSTEVELILSDTSHGRTLAKSAESGKPRVSEKYAYYLETIYSLIRKH